MGAFGGFIQTNKGRNLQAKAETGTQLKFTRMGIGDGQLSGQSIPSLNRLISEKKSLPITRLKTQLPAQAIVGAVLSNQDVTTGFYLREMGIFAEDPDEGEILYAYGNSGSGAAEYISAGGTADIIEKTIDMIVSFGQAQDVSAVIDSSLVYVTHEELAEALEGLDPDIPPASLTEPGIVQLSNAINSTSDSHAATPSAVKKAHDRADQAFTAGNERKAEVVAALVAIGVSASTNETWAQLIPKIAAVIRATGNATAADILAGKSASNASGPVTGSMPNRGAITLTPGKSDQAIPAGYHNGSGKVAAVPVPADKVLAGTTIAGTAGTMPHLTGTRAATGAAQWPDGALAVYPEKGYQKGGVGDGEIKVSVAQLQAAEPNLSAGNIRSGKKIYGVTGTLEPAVKGTATLSTSLSRYDVLPLQTRRFPVVTVPAGATMIEFEVEDNSATATLLEIVEVTPSNPCLIYLCLKDSAGNEIRLFTLNHYQNSQTWFQHGVINFLTPSLTYVYSNYPNSTEHKIFSFNPIAAAPNFNRNQPMSLEVVAYNYNDTYTAKYSHYIRGKLSYM